MNTNIFFSIRTKDCDNKRKNHTKFEFNGQLERNTFEYNTEKYEHDREYQVNKVLPARQPDTE